MDKVGLVLSGGGMRGIAHIGVLKALSEYQFDIHQIAGSSSGAIVGALYAHGYDWEEMLDFFRNIQIFDLKKYARKKPGIIDAEKFHKDFSKFFRADSFDSLKIPLIVTATDILTGDLNLFDRGELIRPILASAAFPGIFAPVKITDSYYVDGGVLNNFPIEALDHDCTIKIGSYANTVNTLSIKELKHSYNVVERAFKLKTVKEDIEKFKKFDLIFAPKSLSQFATFDKKPLMDIYDLGYKAAIELLEKKAESLRAIPIKKKKSKVIATG